MNRTSLAIPALAAALLAPVAAHAVPTQLSANAGEVRDIKYASGSGASAVLYAATQGGGVFKSTNAGATWAKTGLNAGYAWRVAVSSLSTSRVYAATDRGLFRSTDAGLTWTQLTFDPARSVTVSPFSVTNDTVLLGVPGQGILRSTDNGANWTRATGLDSTEVTNIAFQSTLIAYATLDCNYQDIVGTTFEGNWGGIFRSVDGGASWTNYNAGGGAPSLPTKCTKGLAVNPTTVFVGTYVPGNTGGSVYRSTGTGWIAPAAPGDPASGDIFGVDSLALDRNSATTIHAGSLRFGLRSSPSSGTGTTYVQKSDPTPRAGAQALNQYSWTQIHAIETVPGLANTVLIAAKGIGILRTTNLDAALASIVWSGVTGLTADRARSLANHASAAPDTFWMALENGGVMKSTNAGASWTPFNTGFDFGATLGAGDPYLLSAQAIAADPSSTATVLVGTRGGGLLNLAAGGTAWENAGVPLITRVGVVDFKPQSLAIPSSGLVFYTLFDGVAGGKAGGLLRSATGPANLAQTPYPDDIVSCATPVAALGSAYRVIPTSGSRAYLLRYDGLPYRSTDNFASNTATCVTAPDTGFQRLAYYDIAEQPTNPTVLVGATNKGIYRSTDSGANWARLSTAGLGAPVLSSIAFNAAGYLYGVTRDGKLFCSADNGVNWQTISLGGLPAVSFREVRIVKGQVHIVTDGGGIYTGFTSTCP